jgi:hypothetical protein
MANFAGQALSPLVLIGLVLSGGRAGFIALGAWFALLGLTGPAVARWGERTRPAVPSTEDAGTAVAVADGVPVPVPEQAAAAEAAAVAQQAEAAAQQAAVAD